MRVIAVDDPGTLEVDDAISLEVGREVHRLGVHVALVAPLVPKGSQEDREAFKKGVSVYRPGDYELMLPAETVERGSLSLREARPVLSGYFDVDEDGNIRAYAFRVEEVRLSERMDYPTLRLRMRRDPWLRTLYLIAVSLAERRRMRGGRIIPLPFLRVVKSKDGWLFQRACPDDPDQVLVTEPMILYNATLAALFARERVPAVYRHQPEPHGKTPSRRNPLYPTRAVYAIRRSGLSAEPKPHQGLALPAYLQATSPFRRYADLVNQRQAIAFFNGEPLPYSKEEIEGMLEHLKEREREAKRVQREAVRQLVLEHLEGKVVKAIVSRRRKGGRVFVPEFVLELPLVERPEELREGQWVKVRVEGGAARVVG